jgi:hypothetical protein
LALKRSACAAALRRSINSSEVIGRPCFPSAICSYSLRCYFGSTYALIDLPDEQPIYKKEILPPEEEEKLRDSIQALKIFKQLEERGYGDLLLARYPSLRKYFAEFIQLPFAVEKGRDDLMMAINMIRDLDSGELKKLPKDAPTAFVPKELRRLSELNNY